jgi:polyribonucleotide nucleotidyltransferase
MDAGVPIIAPVAGIAMGLIERDGKYVTLTDILGAEDALGDMDFKVAGTADIITALQLDTKLSGLPSDVLTAALDQAKEARLAILDVMNATISGPRTELNRYAPRIETIEIPKDKIGEVIGPKGKVIREMEEETGATIEIAEEGNKGLVRIASNDAGVLAAAKERVMMIVFPPEAEIGKEYQGNVVNLTKFGAFINILPGRDGLLHISKMDPNRRVDRVEDYLTVGDVVKVVVGEIDKNGKLSLELAQELTYNPDPNAPPVDDRPRGDRDRDRDRGGRGGDRGGDRGGRGGDRDRGGDRSDRGGDRNRGGDRDRGGDRNRDRAPERSQAPAPSEGGERRRAAVSFEDTFESQRKD